MQTSTGDPDRFGFRSRRVAWALGVSCVVHVFFVASIARVPAARAAALPTMGPLLFETPAPIAIATVPPSTPRPSLPPTPPPRSPPPLPRHLAAAAMPPHRQSARVARVAAVPPHDPARGEPRDAPGGAPTAPYDGIAGSSGDGSGTAAAPSTGVPADGPPATGAPPATAPACAMPDAAAHSLAVADPEMSDEAKERGESGTVRIRVVLDASGAILATSIDTSSGFGDLDRAALRAAGASRFAPETRSCAPVGGSYLFVATFDP